MCIFTAFVIKMWDFLWNCHKNCMKIILKDSLCHQIFTSPFCFNRNPYQFNLFNDNKMFINFCFYSRKMYWNAVHFLVVLDSVIIVVISFCIAYCIPGKKCITMIMTNYIWLIFHLIVIVMWRKSRMLLYYFIYLSNKK